MTRNHIADSGVEPENAALRSELRTRADLVTILPPPIPAVRRNARKRRARRRLVQGLSGLAVTCAVVAGVITWSPRRDAGIGPAPGTTNSPTPARTSASPAPTPSPTPAPTHTAASPGSGFLLAADLGAGWAGPFSDQAPRPELLVAGSQCDGAAGYQRQVPVTPAPSRKYQRSAPGGLSNTLLEAVYTFAAGTGPTVMARIRAAVETGCGQPAFIKLLSSPSTAADDAIEFTIGENSRSVLVRSGDRVAYATVVTTPAGQEGGAWIDDVARQMAIRLTTG